MKYIKKFERNGYYRNEKLNKISEVLNHIEPDDKVKYSNQPDYRFNIDFEYDNVKYYMIRAFGYNLENIIMYGDDKPEYSNDGHYFTELSDNFIDKLYDYFEENYSQYINGIDMGLL